MRSFTPSRVTWQKLKTGPAPSRDDEAIRARTKLVDYMLGECFSKEPEQKVKNNKGGTLAIGPQPNPRFKLERYWRLLLNQKGVH